MRKGNLALGLFWGDSHWNGRSLCATGSTTTGANLALSLSLSLRLVNSNLCSPHRGDIIYNQVHGRQCRGQRPSFLPFLYSICNSICSADDHPIVSLPIADLPYNLRVCTWSPIIIIKLPTEHDPPFFFISHSVHLNKIVSSRFLNRTLHILDLPSIVLLQETFVFIKWVFIFFEFISFCCMSLVSL